MKLNNPSVLTKNFHEGGTLLKQFLGHGGPMVKPPSENVLFRLRLWLCCSRAVARGGAGGQCHTTNPFCPSTKPIFDLSKSRRSVRENAMVFSHTSMPILKSFYE